ncbi:hypothetical protein DVR12_15115 [Chitinophaga silvatica]|uniref:Prokaryotic RING finger family 4 n=1 Tax=Chitinophaga silvatica TaxID=2282649 RepID=A0A3E1Y996_9BACT|nr:TerD family protein [Chitinophaga silvatica]RFS21973.1 hypothetical protein DVR12_15115 [Chitinophaga silvatica]
MKQIIATGLRQRAILIPSVALNNNPKAIASLDVCNFIVDLSQLGFGVTPALLDVLGKCDTTWLEEIKKVFSKVMATNVNWAPLIKNWEEPITIHRWHYLINYFNQLYGKAGTEMPCGHYIAPDTFPLNRYNGCPYCGTPFEFSDKLNYGQGSKLRVLDLWTEKEAQSYLSQLLASKTPLDAGRIDDLTSLLQVFPLPEVTIGMKETIVKVVDILIQLQQEDRANELFTTPKDILRYLWYKRTGNLQVASVKTVIRRLSVMAPTLKSIYHDQLKLKYNRQDCRRVAEWINNLPMNIQAMCENMHPQREMWVRFIRALRLPEYAKRKGFEKLATLLDVFYREDYTVWQGEVDTFRRAYNTSATLAKLQERPGLFARSLFANLLWFREDLVCEAFAEIAHKVPARILLSLQMYAPYYFDKSVIRSVKPLGSITKEIPAHPLLALHDEDHIKEMPKMVNRICANEMTRRFSEIPATGNSIYIAPELYTMPLPIGDRSANKQNINPVEAGSRFKLQGNEITLFMHWGEGLPAQHMDMDLSCLILGDHLTSACYYGNLQTTGCKHSGDIQRIPNEAGAAEYIRIKVSELQKHAQYVVFACNAFTNGDLVPTVKVGWMNDHYPIQLTDRGVAYDPSCVQHMIQITQPLQKGLVFGVLDVESCEIIWAEIPFDGQTIFTLEHSRVKSLINKLKYKLTIGELLEMKARAQQLKIVPEAEADEVYTLSWGRNSAAVSTLLID